MVYTGIESYILVEHGRVGVAVLLNDGHDEGNEFGPEVQVLDAGARLLWRNLLPGLETPTHTLNTG